MSKPMSSKSKPPVNEARKLGTPPPAKVKKHERELKTSEADKIERGRKLAASFLEKRDGMIPEIARMVVDGMEPDEINNLIVEANTTVIEKTPKFEPPAGRGNLIPDEAIDEVMPEFDTIELLAANADFPGLVAAAVKAARLKNESERQYKENKKRVLEILRLVGVEKVAVFGVKLSVYTGHTKFLDPIKLLEAGVDMDVINRCYSDTPYDDVRMMAPKGWGG